MLSAGGYTAVDQVKNSTAQVLGAGVTGQVVSNEFHITPPGSVSLRIDLFADDVTAGAGISFDVEFWKGVDGSGANIWEATGKAAVSITGDGVFSQTFCFATAGDAAYLPLTNKARVIVTTGAGSAVTIDKILVLQGE